MRRSGSWRELSALTIGLLLFLRRASAGDSTAEAEESAEVLLDGERVFVIRGSLGILSAHERAALAGRTIEQIAQDPFYSPDLITVQAAPGRALVSHRGSVVGGVSETDAKRHGQTALEYAESVVRARRSAIALYRERRSPERWTRAWISLGVATLILIALLWGLRRGTPRLGAYLDARRRQFLQLRDRPDLGATSTWLIKRVLGALSIALTVFLVIAYLQLAFMFVPITRGYALALLRYVTRPIQILTDQLIANIGDLFFVFVLVVLTRYVLIAIRWLFQEAERGAISLPGVSSSRARALYGMVRLVVIAISGVMIYPYIPGSQTAAFRGARVFIGALLTFGASGAASSLIGGLLLMTIGGVSLGDRITLGGVTGDVVETNLFVTRLRTPKNEVVTVSNSAALSSNLINYSPLARKDGLILHTEVTIGYDSPWRTLHELLIDAARRTPGILARPKPFVLQRSLNDYHITYQLNARTHDASRQEQIYSQLHQNIQDAFAEGGVEIRFPQYSSLRDGSRITIPPAIPGPTAAES